MRISWQIINMFIMIDKELDKRKELFVDYGGSYTNYIEQSGEKLPLINIIINNYEVFSENMGNFVEMLSTMYRDTLKYGVSFVITTGAANSFRAKLAEYFSNKLVLQMANNDDYRNLLSCEKGLVPFKTRGRGIMGIGDMKYEFQTAFITKPNKITQTVREGVQILQKNYTTCAQRVPVLPKVVSVDHLSQDIKDLTRVPVGVNYNTKLNETFDFDSEKVLLVVAENEPENEKFFFSLFNILKRIPKTKVRVLDPIKGFDVSKIPVECYIDKFNELIPALTNEMQAESEIKRVYVINGASKLKDKLNDDTLPLWEKFLYSFKDNQSTTLVLVDDEYGMQRLEIETWFDDVVNNKRGIWIGNGLDSQNIFDISRLDPEIREIEFEDMAFIINNGNVIPFKKVVIDKEETDNEK